jgi:hypothetical protein
MTLKNGTVTTKLLADELGRVRGLVGDASESLPREARLEAIRRDLALEDPGELALRIARTAGEFERAFALAHDAYVDAGLSVPHPSGLRVMPHHALPSTALLVASSAEEVVGTLSVIRDGVFGMPMEKEFDVSGLRTQGLRLCEVSSLAIAGRLRNKGRVLFPLIKYLMHVTRGAFGINRMLLVTHPRDADLYGAIAMARPFSDKLVQNYGFANGAPALASIIDLDTFPEELRAVFQGGPPERDYYRFVYQVAHANFRPPSGDPPRMTPELLDYFFNQKTDTFARLSAAERRALRACYPLPEYEAVLPAIG